MVYVQYYHTDLANNLSEACGDRAVFILDGRNTLTTMHSDAVANNGMRRPKYEAYRIFKGSSFLYSQPITEIIRL